MMGRETIWQKVQVHDYVKDKQGNTWRVDAVRLVDADKAYLLTNREGKKAAVTPWMAEPVIVLEPTEDEALLTVQQLLGAEVVMIQDYPKKPGYCPPPTQKLESMWSHLQYFHGIYCRTGPGSRSMQRLLDLHELEHAEGAQYNTGSDVFHRHTR